MIIATRRKRVGFSIYVQGDVVAGCDASDAGKGNAADRRCAAQRRHGCRLPGRDREEQFIVLTAVERQPTRGCLIGADRHGCRGNGKRRCFQHRANLAGFAQPRQIE
ncbi:hypothetical protein Cabther_A1734 [Chloracidobacterium thermophilum B]|uniref:Uncharacterized protein n=1 Tax=Chloracidobacterium thermophilum (strain B) TaxID=981222 RepID=G2LDM0_CHLTF|nr:hypothetical protein Cabther_A1734 [Chloracidobacterium thermophilum B]